MLPCLWSGFSISIRGRGHKSHAGTRAAQNVEVLGGGAPRYRILTRTVGMTEDECVRWAWRLQKAGAEGPPLGIPRDGAAGTRGGSGEGHP